MSTRRPRAQLPPHRTAVVVQVHSQNGGHFDLSWAIPIRRTSRCYSFAATAKLALSQVTLHLGIASIPIPKNAGHLFIAIHVRFRGQGGHHQREAEMSANDPKRTFALFRAPRLKGSH